MPAKILIEDQTKETDDACMLVYRHQAGGCGMVLEKQAFSRRYTALMLEYAESFAETPLLAIEKLGREMVLSNIPPEDIGKMHDVAIAELMASPELSPERVRAASQPLMQLLMAYGIAFREVRAKQEIELALIESEQNYQFVVEQVSDGIAIVQDGINVYVNPAIAKMWGMAVENIAGGHFLDPIHPDEHARLAEIYKQRMAGAGPKKPYEVRCLHANGNTLWVEMKGSLINYQGRPATLVSVRDITERKKSEVLLKQLSSAIEQAGESIMITDRAGILEYVNPAFTSITGYSSEEAIGQTPRLLNSGNQDAAFYEAMWKIIMDGKVWHGKVIDKRKDGSFYPAMLTISPIFDDVTGAITHFVGIHSDLSSLEDMENRFHQAQKMEAVGTMVGGIAHNFNNMLAGMTGNLYLAKQKMQGHPDVMQKLANVEYLSHHAADMIQQLLAFARKGMVSIKDMPLTPFISEVLKLLCASVPENIVLYQDICADDLIIKGDASQLHQVLANLVNNARDAVEGVGKPCITIKLEPFQTDDTFIENHPYFKAGDYALLSVADNGMGIPEHQIEHLFEPFFTTKEQGKGTGLGLSMVYGAVKTHHGFVEVDSSPGKGSTFHIFIPLLKPKERAADSVQKLETTEGQGELILLADDEQIIREVMAEMLESLGYRVIMAVDGLEAFEIFKAHEQEISIALLDMIMPHMGGAQLAGQIRAIMPELPVIFLTGYDKEYALRGQYTIENSRMFTKPVNFGELSHCIRKMLD